MAIASRLGGATEWRARAPCSEGWDLVLGFDPSPPICRASLGVRDGRDRDASVFRHEVDDRVRKPRQQVAPSTGGRARSGAIPMAVPLSARRREPARRGNPRQGLPRALRTTEPLLQLQHWQPDESGFASRPASGIEPDSNAFPVLEVGGPGPDLVDPRRSSSFQDAAASASSGSTLWIS